MELNTSPKLSWDSMHSAGGDLGDPRNRPSLVPQSANGPLSSLVARACVVRQRARAHVQAVDPHGFDAETGRRGRH